MPGVRPIEMLVQFTLSKQAPRTKASEGAAQAFSYGGATAKRENPVIEETRTRLGLRTNVQADLSESFYNYFRFNFLEIG